MRALFATTDFGTAANRKKAFLPLLAHELADRGHEVSGIQHEDGPTHDAFPVDVLPVTMRKTPWWAGFWEFYRAWRRRVDRYLSGLDTLPDVVVADKRCHVPTVQAARGYGVPVVGIVVSVGPFRFAPRISNPDKTPTLRSLPWNARVQYPFVRRLLAQQRRTMPAFAERIVVSDFLRETVEATFGVDSEVVRTPIPLDAVTAADPDPEAIVLLNPRSERKGGHIVARLAERLTDERFLVAGTVARESTRRTFESLDNVTFPGYVEDIREVFARAKLLLVPSLVEEGGPRVIGEAFANGVPVVGTGRGAIPEFVGDAGEIVSPPTDLDKWTDAIRAVLADRTAYADRATDRASLFDAAERLPPVERLLNRVAST